MAKKKNSSKKHRFKYAQPTGVVQAPETGAAVRKTADRPVSVATAAVATERDFSYVGHDLRRLGLLAVGLLAIELILWFLFGHTSLGTTVDSWIHI